MLEGYGAGFARRDRFSPTLVRAVSSVLLVLAGVALVLIGGPEEGATPVAGQAPAVDAGDGDHAGAERVAVRSSRTGHRAGDPVVQLTVGGVADVVATDRDTVGGLLEDLGVEVGGEDEVHPDPDTAIVDGMAVTVLRIEVRSEERNEALEHGSVEQPTEARSQGERVVVRAGEPGAREVREDIVVVDGVELRRDVTVLAVRDPVDEIVEVGTAQVAAAPPPSGGGSDAGSGGGSSGGGSSGGGGSVPGDVWDRLAQCEANGNWSANTGNGYFGGLQFHPQTWASHGGHDYAPNAHLASRSQQITVAERVLASQGWAAWPWCSRHLGLR